MAPGARATLELTRPVVVGPEPGMQPQTHLPPAAHGGAAPPGEADEDAALDWLASRLRTVADVIQDAGVPWRQAVQMVKEVVTELTPPAPGGAGPGQAAAAPSDAGAPPPGADGLARELVTAIHGVAEGARPACPGAPALFVVEFSETVADAETVGAKVRDMFGGAGPVVMVQTIVEAEGKVWRRPGNGWAAEKGGDAHVFTLRLYIPPRPGMNKITTATIRWKKSAGTIAVQGIKANLTEYAGAWTRAFGRIASSRVLGPSAGAPPPTTLDQLWRR